MKKIPLLPNAITTFGLCCGLFVIFKVTGFEDTATSASMQYSLVGILLLAALADLLDGAVARAMRLESDFGGIFDALADTVSFAVAPPVVVLMTFQVVPGEGLGYLVTTAALFYSVCGILRLVRYSVHSQETKGDEVAKSLALKNFTGLPIPAAAGGLLSLHLFTLSFPTLGERRVYLLSLTLFMLGYLMISHHSFFSLKALRVSYTSFRAVLLTALSLVIFFYTVIYHFAVALLLVSWGYILVAMVLSFHRRWKGEKGEDEE